MQPQSQADLKLATAATQLIPVPTLCTATVSGTPQPFGCQANLHFFPKHSRVFPREMQLGSTKLHPEDRLGACTMPPTEVHGF